MNKILRIMVGMLCLVMLLGMTVSCITIQSPTITTEEKVFVEKILARRVGYEIAKKHMWLAMNLQPLSNKAVAVLEGVSTDAEINDAMSAFVEKLTSDYLTEDPMLQRDVLDLAEVLMPTISVDVGDEVIILDENLKAELIVIFKAFNEGVDIAIMQEAK